MDALRELVGKNVLVLPAHPERTPVRGQLADVVRSGGHVEALVVQPRSGTAMVVPWVSVAWVREAR